MKRHQVRQRERVRKIQWHIATSTCALAAAIAHAPAALAQEATVAFDIASQPLPSALLAYGRQANVSVLAPSELVAGRTAPAVRGALSAPAALERLLEGSGLKFEFVQTNAVRIVGPDEASRSPDREWAKVEAENPEDPDRIVVTGTTIRGVYPSSSPVEIYTSDDISRSGAVTTEQFVAKLPQNLGSVSQYAAGSTSAGANYDGVTAVDLRGLGIGTTLTLLNGRRMALSNSGQSADVSMIPASAIARVEVLTDGASAIYGSDAIGGVVNFVLRDDFEGAETRLSYGGVTEGGLRQGDATQTFGTAWDSGRALVSYNYHTASALERSDRGYSAPSGPGTLTPIETRHNLFLAGSQDFGDQLTLDGHLGYGRKEIKNEVSNLVSTLLARNFQSYHSDTDQYFGDLSLDYALNDSWNASAGIAYSEIEVAGSRSTTLINRVPRPAPTVTDFSTHNTLLDINAKIEGGLFALPGGDLRFSAGAGVFEEEFKGYSPTATRQTAGTLGRRSPYAFAEVFAPLVSPAQKIPLIHRLELSLAARYTDYEDTSTPTTNREFGDSTDPKIGVFWAPSASLGFRGTYGTSFRAPSLSQVDGTGGVHFLTTTTIGGVANSAYLGVAGYAVPDLGPETATSYTAGFDYNSETLQGFRFSGTYYNIDYTDRIGIAPTGGINPFTSPLLLPDLIYRPPSAAYIEALLRETALLTNTTTFNLSDPAAASQALYTRPNFWIYDTRYKNLAVSRQDGYDLSASYSASSPVGELRFSASLSHIISYQQQGSPAATILNAVDLPGKPADWRGRLDAGISSGPFDGSIHLNWVDGYKNPAAAIGSRDVGGWTTVDLNVSYQLDAAGEGNGKGARISLSAQNILDEDPPFLTTGTGSNILYPIGFDPANANPLGRFLAVSFVQPW